MTRSSDAVLFTTPVLVPTDVFHSSAVPASKHVAMASDLPAGWHAILLNLWPDVLENENRSLIATVAKPRANPHAKRSDGELLRRIRRRVHGWLNGRGLPRDAVDSVVTLRARMYAEASTFATGSPDGWRPPVPAYTKPAKANAKPRQPARRQSHKPRSPRRDTYWVLTTDKGRRVLYKAASAVGRAMSSGTAPLPPGWHLTRCAERGDGDRGNPAKKILRARADYDADPSIPLAQRLAIEAFVTWVKNAAGNPTSGR